MCLISKTQLSWGKSWSGIWPYLKKTIITETKWKLGQTKTTGVARQDLLGFRITIIWERTVFSKTSLKIIESRWRRSRWLNFITIEFPQFKLRVKFYRRMTLQNGRSPRFITHLKLSQSSWCSLLISTSITTTTRPTPSPNPTWTISDSPSPRTALRGPNSTF